MFDFSDNFITKEKKNESKNVFRLLLVIDQFFNVLFWNGANNETISGNIGRSIQKNKANISSKCVCFVLIKIQNRHCIKSIGE